MPINEALFAAMKAASYIKPNAGKSYKLQRVAEELIAKQAPDNPEMPCRGRLRAYGGWICRTIASVHAAGRLWSAPARSPGGIFRQWHARGLGNIRDSARRITQSPTQNTHQGKHVERQRRRYFRQCQHGTSLSHAAWHDPVFPRWRLDHRGGINLYTQACAHMAVRLQRRVISVEYRLAPEYRFPTAVEDCYEVARQLFAGELPISGVGGSVDVDHPQSAARQPPPAGAIYLRQSQHRIPTASCCLATARAAILRPPSHSWPATAASSCRARRCCFTGSRQRLQSRDQPVRIGADQRHRLHPHRTGHGRLHRHVPFVRGRSDQSVFRAAHRARPEQSAAHAGVVRRILPAQRRGRSVRPSPAIGERQRLLLPNSRWHPRLPAQYVGRGTGGHHLPNHRAFPRRHTAGTSSRHRHTANAPEGGDAWQDVLGTD